jgi:hypothetical protein
MKQEVTACVHNYYRLDCRGTKTEFSDHYKSFVRFRIVS